MAYIMLSTNYSCTINKAQDNQLVVGVCLLVAGSALLQARALGKTKLPASERRDEYEPCRDYTGNGAKKVLPTDLNKEIFQ